MTTEGKILPIDSLLSLDHNIDNGPPVCGTLTEQTTLFSVNYTTFLTHESLSASTRDSLLQVSSNSTITFVTFTSLRKRTREGKVGTHRSLLGTIRGGNATNQVTLGKSLL